MKPIEKLGIGLLYFNKGIPQFEWALQNAVATLGLSGLVDVAPVPIVQDGAGSDFGRERVVDEVRARALDAVLWIDTDLIVPRNSIVRLVKMSNAGWPIAAGLYRKHGFDPADHHLLALMPGANRWATLEELRAAAEGGVTRVDMSAGGFSIVRREVYDTMRKKIKGPWYCNYDWERGDWCIEDTFFMRRVHALKIPVVVDPELHAVHWGRYGPVPVTPDAPEMAEYVL